MLSARTVVTVSGEGSQSDESDVDVDNELSKISTHDRVSGMLDVTNTLIQDLSTVVSPPVPDQQDVIRAQLMRCRVQPPLAADQAIDTVASNPCLHISEQDFQDLRFRRNHMELQQLRGGSTTCGDQPSLDAIHTIIAKLNCQLQEAQGHLVESRSDLKETKGQLSALMSQVSSLCGVVTSLHSAVTAATSGRQTGSPTMERIGYRRTAARTVQPSRAVFR